ncbi:MAG: hypothetical protein KatS3mg131_3781 [Candidatus Tectimicrobiota bacterium]|nr:MAG: hypothetical protein KatS3mg131_3781 [Candidatus Tectomicrobia bacterium]
MPALPLRQFACFLGVGAVGTAVHYGTLMLLVALARLSPVLASGIGFVLGALVNYGLNYRLTFRSTKSHLEAVAKFYAVAFFGLGLNTLLLGLLIWHLHLHYVAAQVAATATVSLVGFIGNRCWTFHEARHGKPSDARRTAHPSGISG